MALFTGWESTLDDGLEEDVDGFFVWATLCRRGVERRLKVYVWGPARENQMDPETSAAIALASVMERGDLGRA